MAVAGGVGKIEFQEFNSVLKNFLSLSMHKCMQNHSSYSTYELVK